VFVSILYVSVHEDVEALGMFTVTLYAWDETKLSPMWVDDSLFREGNSVEIQMGFEGLSVTTRMVGEITGLEPEFSVTQAPTLTVRGYDRRHRLLRGYKTRSFTKVKDSEIARQIATEAGLTGRVVDSTVTLDYVLQQNQTDLDFLRERARRIGYEVVAEDTTLHFRPPRTNQAPTAVLSLDDTLIEFSPRLTTMTQVGEVIVRGWDRTQKQAIVAKASAGQETSLMGGNTSGPQAARRAFGTASGVIVQQPFSSKAEADQIALGRLNTQALAYISGEGVCNGGNPHVRAGEVVKIVGVGRRFSGLYYVTATAHTFSATAGYTTSFSVRRNAT
jgi:phage protein D